MFKIVYTQILKLCAKPDADEKLKAYAGREQKLFDMILK